MNPFYFYQNSFISRNQEQNHQEHHQEQVPQPLEGLHELNPPPFLTKTYEIIEDPRTDEIVSWNRGGTSFVVWDLHSFSTSLLPTHFKHSNFSSFVRQLNTYGFRKIESERWEFANEGFLMGQRRLLKTIKRRTSSSSSSSIHQSSSITQETEVTSLRKQRQILIMELINLRKHQQNTLNYIKTMEQRLKGAEKKQRQMMSFLAKAMQNPCFLYQLLQRRDKRKELEEAAKRKREIKVETLEYLSELEALAMEIQGYGRQVQTVMEEKKVEEEEEEEEEEDDLVVERELDDGFWEELLSNESTEELPSTSN